MDRRFLLISKDEDGHDVLTWCETEKELKWCVENNKALIPYDALEIINYRDIHL